MNQCVNITDLIGKTLTAVEGAANESERIVFRNDAETYTMLHERDSCESEMVEDVVGDVTDLIGAPIVAACEERRSKGSPGDDCEGFCRWTFYRVATIKGAVTICWFGSSSGYYPESVLVYKVAQ